MKKTKVLHLVNELGLDGSSKVVLNLCNLFNDNQHEVSVVSLTGNINLVNSNEWPQNIRVYSFNYFYDPDYSLRKYIALYLNQHITRDRGIEIIKCIESIKPDILHCHLQPRELIIALQLKLHGKTQFLFTDHLVRLKREQYSFINTWILSWIYRKIYSQFHIVAVAKSVFDCHEEYSLVSRKKIHALIANKIDSSKFVPAAKETTSIKVIYVARLEKRKGQDILLKAWSKIDTAQKIELVLVGGGDFEEELRPLTIESRHPVVFTGSVENVLPHLQSAHIAVFSSLQEGLPLALLEKMSCGLPVIASDIKEFQGIIDDGKNGLFFRAGDPTDLRDKLQLLLKNPDLRERLGNQARKFVVDNYDLDKLKSDYESVYNRLISLS